MATLSPTEYADRYLDLTVPNPVAGQADLAKGISAGKYLIGSNYSMAARSTFLRRIEKNFTEAKKKKIEYKVRVRVDVGDGKIKEHEFDKIEWQVDDPLYRLLRYPFAGKGSPEAIQAVLQLAATPGPTGEAPLISADAIQKYCDDHLGTDCNGFVGNFLRNEVFGGDETWWKPEGKNELGPQNLINSLADKAPGAVRITQDTISFNDYNIVAEVDSTTGRIIPGGAGPDGHIGISEPGKINYMTPIGDGPIPEDFVRIGKTTYRESNVASSRSLMGIRVVESTGPQRTGGIRKSWYQITEHPLAQKQAKFKGVFRLFRGVKKSFLDFRLKSVTTTT